MSFCLKIRTPVYNEMGHVSTNNGVASAKRYHWGHAKQDRVSAGVFCSSMARWKYRFLWTLFSCGQRPRSTSLGPKDTSSFSHGLVYTHGDKMYLSWMADWPLGGLTRAKSPTWRASDSRWLSLALQKADSRQSKGAMSFTCHNEAIKSIIVSVWSGNRLTCVKNSQFYVSSIFSQFQRKFKVK